jgi:hypothetical protein
VSGLLEVSGLAVWGARLWRIMAGRSTAGGGPVTKRLVRGDPITARSRVGDVLELYPSLLATFFAFGFRLWRTRRRGGPSPPA